MHLIGPGMNVGGLVFQPACMSSLGSLAQWHGIAAGRPLDADAQAHDVRAIERWLAAQIARPADRAGEGTCR